MESIRGAVRTFRSSTAFIAFVVAYAVFTDQFLFAAIIPVYPYSLHERIGIAKNKVQLWISILLGVFGLACVLVAIPLGWYTDRTRSRRVPFTIGLLVLLGATLILWLVDYIAGQVVARALQGLASTIVWTTGLAVLVDTVGQEHIGEYMGYVGIALNAGSLVAPFLGGIVFAQCGYHAVYGLIIAIVVLDIVFRLVMVEQIAEQEFDLERTAASSPRPVITVELASVQSLDLDKSPDITKTIAVGQISVSSQTTLVERPSPSPTPAPETTSTSVQTRKTNLPPILRLLPSARFLIALWGIFVLATVFSGFQATLPLFVEHTFSWNSIGSGLIFIPLSLPSAFGPWIGRIVDRYSNSSRWFASSGMLIFCASLVCLRFVDGNTIEMKVLLCALLVCVGSCMALILEPLFAETSGRAKRLEMQDREDGVILKGSSTGYYGSAYAWFNIAWASGNFLGPLSAGLVMDHAGWKTMTWMLGLIGGVSALPVGLWCGGWYFSRKKGAHGEEEK